MGRGILLIRTFVLKVINNKRNILTYHEIIDRIAQQIVSVCKESKLWVHTKLRWPNFSFTYSSKFTYFYTVDV